MPDASDMELLQDYSWQGSEEAFAEVVRRHVNLVYSAALRHVGIAAHAEEITQAVFIILANKAAGLRANTILEAWLYQTTRLTSLSFLRGERRRQSREQEAYMQAELQKVTDTPVWKQIAPLLDEAMARLGQSDREAVVLRFLKEKSLGEVAVALNITEAAAQSRVHRAVEKLQRYFLKRGITSTTTAISGAISANSVQVAPITLAKIATAAALAKGAAAPASTLTLIKGALKIMAWTKAKIVIVTGVVVLLAAGTTVVAVKEIQSHRIQAWQVKYDPSILNKIPPQVRILPAIPSRPGQNWGNDDNGMIGLTASAMDLFECAYKTSQGRIVTAVPLPVGSYDFISNVPRNHEVALQNQITKKFGLTARRELIETNVLLMVLRNRNTPGLKLSSPTETEHNSTRNPYNGSYWCVNKPISDLASFLEDCLKTPVVDQTGLTNNFDIEFIGGFEPEGLKRTVLNDVGLELVPGRATVEFLVIDKAN